MQAADQKPEVRQLLSDLHCLHLGSACGLTVPLPQVTPVGSQPHLGVQRRQGHTSAACRPAIRVLIPQQDMPPVGGSEGSDLPLPHTCQEEGRQRLFPRDSSVGNEADQGLGPHLCLPDSGQLFLGPLPSPALSVRQKVGAFALWVGEGGGQKSGLCGLQPSGTLILRTAFPPLLTWCSALSTAPSLPHQRLQDGAC